VSISSPHERTSGRGAAWSAVGAQGEPLCGLVPSPKGSSERRCSHRPLFDYGAMIRIPIATPVSESGPQGARMPRLAASSASPQSSA
jgi:hypothetical protein